MTDPLAVDVEALFAAAAALHPAVLLAGSSPASLQDVDRLGREHLSGSKTSAALSLFCARWRPVAEELARRAAALAAGLAASGGEYSAVERVLSSYAGTARTSLFP